jgi:hypothetical protein
LTRTAVVVVIIIMKEQRLGFLNQVGTVEYLRGTLDPEAIEQLLVGVEIHRLCQLS